jgi:acetylornithine/succinyldiaminopimelate/putrescine aminotransferase
MRIVGILEILLMTMALNLHAGLKQQQGSCLLDLMTVRKLLSEMVLIAGANVVRLAPSLIIPDTDIDEALARFEAAVKKLTA